MSYGLLMGDTMKKPERIEPGERIYWWADGRPWGGTVLASIDGAYLIQPSEDDGIARAEIEIADRHILDGEVLREALIEVLS